MVLSLPLLTTYVLFLTVNADDVPIVSDRPLMEGL